MKVEIDKDELKWIIDIIDEKIRSTETDIEWSLRAVDESPKWREAAERLKEYKKSLENLKRKLERQYPFKIARYRAPTSEHIT